MSVLLTGSTGFIGQRLLESLAPHNVLCAVRKQVAQDGSICVGDITGITDWKRCFDMEFGVEVIVHCAARVHVMGDKAQDPLQAFREVNTAGTLRLATQAADAGVKRFIFLSSIKVNGESTSSDSEFSINDKETPLDAYGISKMEAEVGLRKLAVRTGMEVVIIRPPLVYGPGVKGNFASMLAIAKKNVPLPLGAIRNKRSLVAVDNLVDLIVTCIDHPKAGNQTFLVSDDYDVSTTELLKQLIVAAGYKPRLIPVPMKFVRLAATLIGRKEIADRLCGSLRIDISHTKDTLGWAPPLSFEEAIARCFLQ